jgi:hypothetical protein
VTSLYTCGRDKETGQWPGPFRKETGQWPGSLEETGYWPGPLKETGQ